MSKAMYCGINNISHKVKKIYLGENNISHKIKKGYIGDSSNKARLFFTSGYTWEKYSVDVSEQRESVQNYSCSYTGYTSVNPYSGSYRIHANQFYIDSVIYASNTHVITYMSSGGGSRPVYLTAINYGLSASAGIGAFDTLYEFTSISVNTQLQSYVFSTNKLTLNKTKGSLIGIVEADELSAYPENGIHTDGYWYVFIAQ